MIRGVTSYPLNSPADTEALAARLAPKLRAGDQLLLAGDLGTGKTSFAQALIRQFLPQAEVTSPTFNLLQSYAVSLADGASCEIWHADLYRIEKPSELAELALHEGEAHVRLIEWPERLGGDLPADYLALRFTLEDGVRRVQLFPTGYWKEKLAA